MKIPTWLADVFAEDDANRAAVRASEERRQARVTKKYDAGLVYKTVEQPVQPLEARPIMQQEWMSPEQQAPWDRWLDRRVEIALNEFLEEIIVPSVAEFASVYVNEKIKAATKKLREEIIELKVINSARNFEKHLIEGSDVPLRRRDGNS